MVDLHARVNKNAIAMTWKYVIWDTYDDLWSNRCHNSYWPILNKKLQPAIHLNVYTMHCKVNSNWKWVICLPNIICVVNFNTYNATLSIVLHSIAFSSNWQLLSFNSIVIFLTLLCIILLIIGSITFDEQVDGIQSPNVIDGPFSDLQIQIFSECYFVSISNFILFLVYEFTVVQSCVVRLLVHRPLRYWSEIIHCSFVVISVLNLR